MSHVRHWLRVLRRLFANLPRRAWLTLRYHGVRETLWRVVTFPLRLTPLGPRLGLVTRMSDAGAPARRWYADHARPVAVVIPSYGNAKLALKAARSVKQTTAARVIVADDGSPAAEVERLRRSRHVDVVVTGDNRGFAANCNRGLRETRPDEDVVLINSDVIAHRGWLEALQYTAYVAGGADVGIVGAKLLYADDTIQFGGAVRNVYAPQWFDHRFRGQRAHLPASEVMQAQLAVTGACMYLTRDTLDAVGELDEGYGMAFEDVDYCLRTWESDRRVLLAPAAQLTHHESKTRGHVQGRRELHAQNRFWETWGDWFDRRETRAPDGGVRIVYVTQDVGVGGGHRVIFGHLNALRERGHHPELWTLGDGPPDWFELEVPVRTFPDYAALRAALAPLDAMKVATWWQTAPHVWEAGLRRGVPVYHVQDIETSYYANRDDHGPVLAEYRPEFTYIAGSQWISRQLARMVMSPTTIVTPGVDLDRWRELPGAQRDAGAILALGRSNPLKRFDLTRDAYRQLTTPPPLWLFGIEPDLADGLGPGVTYHRRPSDAEVNELLNRCSVFLQTSEHEGFCLPVLEAMAAGAPVVCTDADANMEFCRDGVNCLVPAAEPRAIREAVEAVLTNGDLQARLRAEGRRTAQDYALPKKLDELAAFFSELAERRASGEMPRPAASGRPDDQHAAGRVV